MDETDDLRLIEKLKKDTEEFGGKDQYQLLEEYFHGLSIETLHDLLCYEDKLIRKDGNPVPDGGHNTGQFVESINN